MEIAKKKLEKQFTTKPKIKLYLWKRLSELYIKLMTIPERERNIFFKCIASFITYNQAYFNECVQAQKEEPFKKRLVNPEGETFCKDILKYLKKYLPQQQCIFFKDAKHYIKPTQEELDLFDQKELELKEQADQLAQQAIDAQKIEQDAIDRENALEVKEYRRAKRAGLKQSKKP